MMDLVVRAKRAPSAGETVVGSSFSRFPGGKGANQAVAAARLGGEVTMVGKLGSDDFGREMLRTLEAEGIATDYISFDESASTGIGSIVLEEDGQNRIIVVPGANLRLLSDELDRYESAFRSARLLVMQLEMDLAMTGQAIDRAHRHGLPVLLNPAPAQPLSDELLRQVTYLTPNETEAGLLAGFPVHSIADAERAAMELHRRGVKHVIVTLADKGALIVDGDGTRHVKGFPVSPVDTVAAGDSFNGALAVKLINGESLDEAVYFANAVGALTVTKEGAIPSLPHSRDVDRFMQSRSAVS
jgi:ribokinase